MFFAHVFGSFVACFPVAFAFIVFCFLCVYFRGRLLVSDFLLPLVCMFSRQAQRARNLAKYSPGNTKKLNSITKAARKFKLGTKRQPKVHLPA